MSSELEILSLSPVMHGMGEEELGSISSKYGASYLRAWR